MSLDVMPSHVAVLVPSARRAAALLGELGFAIGAEEEWEEEGTREVYVERGRSNALLLMEPIGPGPYRDALAKRGPGLHHFAIDVLDVEGFVGSLAGSGWLLHPRSLQTLARSRTAFLARPGFPGLIEVQGRDDLVRSELFVTEVALLLEPSSARLLEAIRLHEIVVPARPGGEPTLSLAGRHLPVSALL